MNITPEQKNSILSSWVSKHFIDVKKVFWFQRVQNHVLLSHILDVVAEAGVLVLPGLVAGVSGAGGGKGDVGGLAGAGGGSPKTHKEKILYKILEENLLHF